MSSPKPNLTEIRALIQQDLLASNELATPITQLRQDIADGNPPSSKSIAIMDNFNKDRARQIYSLIEDITEIEEKSVEDRELLQALTARQVICDRHGKQLAELRDLEFEARGEREEVVLRPSESPPQQERTLSPQAGLSGASSQVDLDLHADDAGLPSSAQGEDTASGHVDQGDTAVQDLGKEKEAEPDLTSSWPLLYRILNIHPETPQDRFKPACDRARKQLALKHSPKNFPNDPTALERWQAVQKAHEVLSDPARKQFYDAHERIPAGLEGFDVSTLRIS